MVAPRIGRRYKPRAEQFDDRVKQLMPVHRDAFAPAYVADNRVRNAVTAKSIGLLMRGELAFQRDNYLLKVLDVDITPPPGASWSRQFGNFMAATAAFRTLIRTVRRDDRGFVTAEDSAAIRRMIVSLQRYRRMVRFLDGAEVSRTMKLSAAFCGNAVDALHRVFFTSRNRVVVGPGGAPILNSKIGKKNVAAYAEGKLKRDETFARATALFTSDGLAAFREWADSVNDPMLFLRDISAPAHKRVGTGSPNVEIDPFGSLTDLPSPHPSHASAVNRVLVELMGAAEQNRFSLLQFRWNGWRRTIEARVPTAEAHRFAEVMGYDEEMGSLRGAHDWWVERIGAQAHIVIPTQPSLHLRHFETLAADVLKKIADLDAHLRTAGAGKPLEPDANRLEAFYGTLHELIAMGRYLEKQRADHPSARTQESYAVSELIARLVHVCGPYHRLYGNRDDEQTRHVYVQRCLNSRAFSMLEHIPDTLRRGSIPRVRVEVARPPVAVIPVQWVEAHKLMTRLFERIVDIAGAFDQDHTHPVNVTTTWAWDADRRGVVIANPDGRLVQSLNALESGSSYLVPGPVREIGELSRKVAPAQERLALDVHNNVIFMPMSIMPVEKATPDVLTRFPALRLPR